jgi:hypothetical protein
MSMNIIEKVLREKYEDYLVGLDIYETTTSLILSRIVLNKEARNFGIGTKIMQDLTNYADKNKQIIALTPSSDFGGNRNRLIQFYKRFGFKKNSGQYKHFGFKDDMIRYPIGLNEYKSLIKTLLREALDKTIICQNCNWSWKESESAKRDLYVCHKCGHDNSQKKSLNESVMKNDKIDARKVADFVNFAKEYLGINDDIKVALAFTRTPDLRTTAYYDYSGDGFIKVYAKDRAIIDICRSIAHELVHHLQFVQGRLLDANKDGEDGSQIENEANAVAGVIIRKWGKLHSEFYI